MNNETKLLFAESIQIQEDLSEEACAKKSDGQKQRIIDFTNLLHHNTMEILKESIKPESPPKINVLRTVFEIAIVFGIFANSVFIYLQWSPL